MHSLLLIYLLIFQLTYGEHSVCLSSDPPSLLKLALLPAKENANYHYSITNYANPVTIIRNNNGTSLQGDFSTLHLISGRSEYEYISTSLSFKYPPQHRVAEINNEMLELQILYELNNCNNTAWKHKRLALSITFLLTEYAPQQIFTLGKQITPNLQNGTYLDLHALLPLVSSLNVLPSSRRCSFTRARILPTPNKTDSYGLSGRNCC